MFILVYRTYHFLFSNPNTLCCTYIFCKYCNEPVAQRKLTSNGLRTATVLLNNTKRTVFMDDEGGEFFSVSFFVE